MDLWIMSQNKNMLRKIDNAFIDNGNSVDICTYCGDDAFILGEYATIERAKEVLDEIQNLLQPRIIVNNDLDSEQENALCYFLSSKNVGKVMPKKIVDMNCVPIETIVYEMPLE